MLEWKTITTQQLQQFLNENGFHYMFFNSYIYKPYLKKLDKFGLWDKEGEKLVGVCMVEKVVTPAWKERNVMHIAFLREVRGKEAKEMGKKWLSIYLPQYKVLEGHLPKKWAQARVFAKWFNFKQIADTHDYSIVELKAAA